MARVGRQKLGSFELKRFSYLSKVECVYCECCAHEGKVHNYILTAGRYSILKWRVFGLRSAQAQRRLQFLQFIVGGAVGVD